MTKDGFREFVEMRYGDLLRTAFLLTGTPHAAEDLVQTALLNALRHWGNIDDPMSYLRRTMVNQRNNLWRRLASRELITAMLPEASTPDASAAIAQRAELLEALISTGLALLLVPLTVTGGDGGIAVPDPSASPGIEMITPSPPFSPPAPGPMTPWTRSLIDAPPRGSLATEQAFLSQVSDAVSAETYGRPVIEQEKTKVLFAGDVGDFRVVIVSLYNSYAQSVVFMAGKSGALVTEMLPARTASSPPSVYGMDELEPFYRMAFRRLASGGLTFASVALAPPGCTVATAGADLLWKDEPAGSYLASAQSPAGRSARVTCDGRVRFEGAVSDSVIPLVSWSPPEAVLRRRSRG